jgi:fluoroquinolone transport system permease protein
MSSTGIIGALLRKDARVIYRDRFMLGMLVYPLVLAVALRFVVPLVSFDDLALYLAPLPVLFAAMLLGMILGFSLIEERENRTWLLLRVLPIGQRTLFLYLLAVSAGLSLPISLAAALIYGMPVADLSFFVAMSAIAGLLAPLSMLSMGALASNKIEGLALSKIVSSAAWFPALAFFLTPAWQLTIAWNPYYWIYLGLLRAYAGPERIHDLAIYWPDYGKLTLAVAPAVLCVALSLVLARVYRRRAT